MLNMLKKIKPIKMTNKELDLAEQLMEKMKYGTKITITLQRNKIATIQKTTTLI